MLGRNPAVTGAAEAGGAPVTASAVRPVDRLLLAYLVALAALAAARVPSPLPLLGMIGFVALALVGAAVLRGRSAVAHWVHDYFPIVGVLAGFSLSGPVIAAVNPERFDATFAAWDHALFGAVAAHWFGALGRPAWLTDVASVLYCSYYVVPVVMGVALRRTGRLAEFDELVFTVVAAFLLSYVGYFLTPTLGPRVPPDRAQAVIGGNALSAGVRWFLRTVEWNRLDAFPSGHTALALVFLWLGWRMFPAWRAVLALLVCGIIFSTVYLSLHYVVDVVAGVALAAAVPWLVPRLERLATPRGVTARR
jgi:membrane-associated phospholipid phosphatase